MSVNKVFCIGFNKTGTTSLERFMADNGFACGDQALGELLMEDYVNKRWQRLKHLVSTADFFQDLPFGAPDTYAVLDAAFPGSKFILTLRDSPGQWYASLTRFHRRVFGGGKRIPTRADLENAEYRYKGFAWLANRALYKSPPEDPYRREDLVAAYENHRHGVASHFSGRSNLLTLKITDPDAASKLGRFLGIVPQTDILPWLNKSTPQ